MAAKYSGTDLIPNFRGCHFYFIKTYFGLNLVHDRSKQINVT